MTNGQEFYGQPNASQSQQQPYPQTQYSQQPYQQSYQQPVQPAQQVAYGQQAYRTPYDATQQTQQAAYGQQPYQQSQGATSFQQGAVAYQQGGEQWPPVQPSAPQKKRRKGRIAIIILSVVLALALAALAYIGISYWQGRSAYETLATEHVEITQNDPYDLASFVVDWDALRAVNPDVIAWIYVPDTSINYPVVWRENDDSYYLYHNFNGYSSPQFAAEFGCISLSGANQPDFSDQINIISGHNMLDGSMFQPFSTFRDPEVFNAHRTIFLLTPKGNFRLNTFALDYVSGSSRVPINFATRAEFKEYLQNCIDNTLVQPDPAAPFVRTINKAFAFYTCDNSNDAYRFFIYANIADYLPLDGGSRAEAMGNRVVTTPDGGEEDAEGIDEDAQAEDPAEPLEGGAAVGAAVTERIV